MLLSVANVQGQLIPVDKQQHFVAGVIITEVASNFMDERAALGLGITIAIAEELRDENNGRPFDVVDAAYTIVGSVAVFHVRKLIKKRRKRRRK